MSRGWTRIGTVRSAVDRACQEAKGEMAEE
jgi:hypothetical protein